MEDFSFDINGLLSDEEANALFDENQNGAKEKVTEPEIQEPEEKEQSNDAEEPESQEPEKVGAEDENGNGDAATDGDGSSPTKFYSSIASALRNDGIFPEFDDSEIEKIESPEDFAELMEKAVTSRFDERMKRIDAALGNGVAPDTVRAYEQTLQYLGSINEEALSAEGEEAENLRRQLIYNDLINRGYTQERANREIEKSFKSGSDIDDAKDALAALNKFYSDGYQRIQDESKQKAEEAKKARQQNSDKFKKMILDDEIKLGDYELDKKTKQRVFDAVSKPVYKDPDSGQLLTAVQKFQKENPLEFLKQLGMWFVLTDGGKDTAGFSQKSARLEKNKSIRDLERKINASQLGSDGNLRYMGGGNGNGQDPLLSDGWKVDF